MEHKLLVPVRTTAAGAFALRIGRLSSGERIGLAFTSEASLVSTLGPAQQWTDLSWEALLDMLEPLGIEHIRVDPDSDGRPRVDNSLQPHRPLPGQPQPPAPARRAESGRDAGYPLARPAALRGLQHGPGPQCEQPLLPGADAGLADRPRERCVAHRRGRRSRRKPRRDGPGQKSSPRLGERPSRAAAPETAERYSAAGRGGHVADLAFVVARAVLASVRDLSGWPP